MKKLALIICMLTLQVAFSQSKKEKRNAFKEVVSLMESAYTFNNAYDVEVIAHDFKDLTIEVKSVTKSPFIDAEQIELVYLDLKDLESIEKEEHFSHMTYVEMTFSKDLKNETMNEEGTDVYYIDTVKINFKNTDNEDQFMEALEVLM